MSEKDTIIASKIKQKGIFHFKDFYEFAYKWITDEDYDIIEKKYSEKVAGDSKDLEIIWNAEKKISDYFKITIDMHWFILGMGKTKVKKEGKEVSMNAGTLEIRFKGSLVKDYENRWENKPIWKFLRGVYDRYIIRSRIEDYEDKIFEETTELINQLKAFLEIEGKQEL